MRMTAPKQEYLSIDSKIDKFAQSILSKEEINEVERLSGLLAGNKKDRGYAIAKLQIKVGVTPKRPLFYVSAYHFKQLPSHTRDSIKYLGDYLDLLIKAWYHEKTKDEKKLKAPFGAIITILSKKGLGIDSDLLSDLDTYNKLFYSAAKHDFSTPKDRSHFFTPREVVYNTFITLNLASKIKSLSPYAKYITEDSEGTTLFYQKVHGLVH